MDPWKTAAYVPAKSSTGPVPLSHQCAGARKIWPQYCCFTIDSSQNWYPGAAVALKCNSVPLNSSCNTIILLLGKVAEQRNFSNKYKLYGWDVKCAQVPRSMIFKCPFGMGSFTVPSLRKVWVLCFFVFVFSGRLLKYVDKSSAECWTRVLV